MSDAWLQLIILHIFRRGRSWLNKKLSSVFPVEEMSEKTPEDDDPCLENYWCVRNLFVDSVAVVIFIINLTLIIVLRKSPRCRKQVSLYWRCDVMCFTFIVFLSIRPCVTEPSTFNIINPMTTWDSATQNAVREFVHGSHLSCHNNKQKGLRCIVMA